MTISEYSVKELSIKESAGGTKGRYRIQIIEGNRMGSSGFWPREAIERDGPTVWGKGTHIFLDHLSESEEWDRPEGSVRNLAGVIDSVPEYEEATEANGQVEGLYADVQFFPMYQEMIEAIYQHVGMSVRALAEADYQEVDGNVVPIITKIHEGLSVDVVTRAGAGGRILEAIESAKPSMPRYVEKKLLPHSVAESNKGEINMGNLTEETAAELVAAIKGLTAQQEASAAEEAAKESKKDDEPKIEFGDITDKVQKVLSSDLSESSRQRVLDQLKAEGAKSDVDALITAEADYAKKILEESQANSLGKRVSSESASSGRFTSIKEATVAWPSRDQA